LSAPITESVVEEAALEWFEALNYKVLPGPSIAPGEPAAERTAYSDVVLDERLRAALKRLNPSASPEALDEAFRKLTRIASPQPIDSNHELHYYLVNGVSVEYLRPDGTVGYDPVRVLDFDEPTNNDWLAVNQFTVAEKGHTRRPDIVIFVNGLPLAILELKNAASESTTIWSAFHCGTRYRTPPSSASPELPKTAER
jgi:type I restriction enzyme R subunit